MILTQILHMSVTAIAAIVVFKNKNYYDNNYQQIHTSLNIIHLKSLMKGAIIFRMEKRIKGGNIMVQLNISDLILYAR